ncbi:hypothetical protein PR048_008338 [Dryococelus australis]|uniref:Integrase catalytic domain-containing protein n=1 Tax=Dryococelus australis TaxID=614101 RepID=A0ABQ9HWU1_9NEOP|nr:hypothetical protein PR048_008338 [Dryococelus australis]
MFVILDMFIKFVKLYPIKKATDQVITEKLMDYYVLEVSQPRKIISDNGSQFCSDKWKTLTTILGIELDILQCTIQLQIQYRCYHHRTYEYGLNPTLHCKILQVFQKVRLET